MMSMVMNAGWDIANKMNLQVGQATGRVEMLRLMKILGLDKPKNEEEFMMLMTLGMETFITQDYFDYEFKLSTTHKWVGIIKQCYAYTKVRSINVDKDYKCGCFGMRQGWYQAMGLEVKETLLKCLKDGDSLANRYGGILWKLTNIGKRSELFSRKVIKAVFISQWQR